MRIRTITPDDLPDLANLLTEGFPRRSPAYWQSALHVMAERPEVGDLPKYGLVLEEGGSLEGVMLMISSGTAQAPFCNLSSWYLRPNFRKYAALLFQRSLRFKNVTYTDCSPASHVLPIVTKFGFKPYTGGSLVLDPRQILRPSPKILPLDSAGLNRIDSTLRPQIKAHQSYGCSGLLVDKDGAFGEPILYRTTRVKRFLRVVRVLFGDPDTIATCAGGLVRHFTRQGRFVIFADWPTGQPTEVGKILPSYNLRYKRGPQTPTTGNLLETEIGLFGL